MTTLTQKAADIIAALGREDFATDVTQAVELCLLDFIGCCVQARRLGWAKGLASLAQGPDQSFHFGTGFKTSTASAAFANGVMGHSLIREDMHVRSGSHIGVLVLPAMLALAQREGLSGRALIAGIVTGYEISASLGGAIWGSGGHNRHLRPSGMTGAFGVAAGASAAIGATEDQIVDALGIAANFSCGFNQWAWSGGQEIFLHAGMAAQSGLQAVDLARAGMAGSADILEGRDGAFAAFGCGEGAASLFEQALVLDQPRALLGVRHKPVAGCNFVQTPVAAAIAAKNNDNIQSDQIDRIVLHSFAEAQRYPGCDYAGPFTSAQQSKMSLQFAICGALVHDRLDEAAYARFDHPEMLRLIPRVEIRFDPAYEAAFPVRQGARVDLHLKDGSCVSGDYDDVPWLTASAVSERFRKELAQCDAAHAITPIIDGVSGLSQSANCADLWSAFEMLGGD